MFGLFKNNKSIILYSICNGKSISLDSVPDITFSKRLVGDGVAFEFDGDTIYSPCDGEIIMIASTNHAVGIKAANGAEILIHCGMETVNLKGNGLNVLVNLHTKVKHGTPILKIDRTLMNERNINLITPVLLTNRDLYNIECEEITNNVCLDTKVATVSKK